MAEHEVQHPGEESTLEHFPCNEQFLFFIVELFPIPIEIFRPNGLSAYVNKAFLEVFHIPDPNIVVGKFNPLEDSFLLSHPELSRFIKRTFAGDTLTVSDIRVPFEQMEREYKIINKRPKTDDVYQSIIDFPIKDPQGNILYIVTIFKTEGIYGEQYGIQKAREYINANFLEDFDLRKVAKAAGFSVNHFTSLFKKYTGSTPYGYYQNIKVEKLKEALQIPGHTISRAFTSCGMDYNGNSAKMFKKYTGMTPSQYKKSGITNDNEGTANSHKIPASPDVTDNLDMLFRVFDLFLLPIIIFDMSGTAVYVNPMLLKTWNISASSEIVGKYNLIKDPLTNNQLGLNDYVSRIFKGEVVLVPEVKTPLVNFSEWFESRDPVFNIESMYTEILNFPLIDGDKEIKHIVSVFLTTRIYRGNSDIARAREFIENNWKEDLDLEKIAKVAGLSRYHFVRLFKKHTGKTPYSYYQDIKVAKLKEALRDKNKTVSEAFALCGIQYRGSWAALFRKKVGMTPSEYRIYISK